MLPKESGAAAAHSHAGGLADSESLVPLPDGEAAELVSRASRSGGRCRQCSGAKSGSRRSDGHSECLHAGGGIGRCSRRRGGAETLGETGATPDGARTAVVDVSEWPDHMAGGIAGAGYGHDQQDRLAAPTISAVQQTYSSGNRRRATLPVGSSCGQHVTYNACVDLLDRNLPSRRDKLAYIDDCGTYTYGELAERVYRFSNVLKGLGLSMETRVLLCLQDGIDFPVAALGAMRAGMVPVMVSTLLRPAEFDFMLRDSRAQVLVVSERLLSSFTSVLESQPFLREVIVSGTPVDGCQSMSALMAQTGRECTPAPTVADDACLWQYSSGSTGNPKGTVHLHGSLARVAQAYGGDVLGLTANDLTFSAAKLFFGYGFGNGLIFPLAVGATSVLMAERPTPEAVFARLLAYRPSVFYGVPTLYSGMLASSGSS